MLKRKYRLPASIRLSGARSSGFAFFILKTKQNSLSNPRFAFVISKSVDTRATVRNRIKREMTGEVAKIVDKIKASDNIFILKKGAAANIEKLSEEINKAFSQEDLIK